MRTLAETMLDARRPRGGVDGATLRRIVAYTALFGWFVVMSAVAASMLARHAIPLPAPEDGAKLGAALDGMRRP